MKAGDEVVRAGFYISAIFVGLVLILSSCAASAPEKLSSGELNGGMLGLGGEEHEFWGDWTPREAVRPPIVSGRYEVHVFEAWRVEDGELRGAVWDGAFHILGAVGGGGEEEALGVQSVLVRLSAELDLAKLEVSFFTADDGQAEGLIWRLVLSDGAGVWLEGEREAGGGRGPGRWILRVEPAFEEAAGLTLWWERGDLGWSVSQAAGADAVEPTSEQVILGEEQVGALLEVLEETLWESVVEAKFVEPPFELEEATVAGALGPGWPAALGEDVEARGLEDFVSDTVFWPRDGADILEGF